ncbi:MAG TPA: hypothetical protein VJK72_02265 [Candidatus Nanoarchaeia archaeon]|nr:hypothetical protein [Candidatus Nanoarchaeia archaeon]
MKRVKSSVMELMYCLFIDIQKKGRAAVETVEFPSNGTMTLGPIADAAFQLPYVRKVEVRRANGDAQGILWGIPLLEKSKRHSKLAEEGQLEQDMRTALGDATVNKMYKLREAYLQELSKR